MVGNPVCVRRVACRRAYAWRPVLLLLLLLLLVKDGVRDVAARKPLGAAFSSRTIAMSVPPVREVKCSILRTVVGSLAGVSVFGESRRMRRVRVLGWCCVGGETCGRGREMSWVLRSDSRGLLVGGLVEQGGDDDLLGRGRRERLGLGGLRRRTSGGGESYKTFDI